MTVPGDITTDVPELAPDWSVQVHDILCPLCDYNLRGLITPRCPECGHQFRWKEVTSGGSPIHPYLFEHQSHRAIWSFFKTFFNSLFPVRFWFRLLPVHTPVVRRLVLYWGIIAVVLCIALIGSVAFALNRLAEFNAQEHARVLQSTGGVASYYIAQFGSLQAAADRFYPPLTFDQLPRRIWDLQRYDSLLGGRVLPTTVGALLWPWLTLASLMIFRASLSQARIKTGHVLRCVIYSADVLPVLLVLLFAYWMVPASALGRTMYRYYFLRGAVMALPIVLLVLTYRLAAAYKCYLRFPHAIATVIASQLIVGIAMFKLWLTWLGY